MVCGMMSVYLIREGVDRGAVASCESDLRGEELGLRGLCGLKEEAAG
jgi:hypothetical protein